MRNEREIHYAPINGETWCGREVPGAFTTPMIDWATCKDCKRRIAEARFDAEKWDAMHKAVQS